MAANPAACSSATACQHHCRRALTSPHRVHDALPLAEEPLLLYSCAYGGLRFQRSRQNQDIVRGQLEGVLTR